MLSVVNDMTLGLLQKCNAIFDHAQIFFLRRAQNINDVEQPALAENSANRGLCIEKLLKLRVIVGRNVGASRRSECGNFSVLPFYLARAFKKLDIFWIAARPTTFNIGDTHAIK